VGAIVVVVIAALAITVGIGILRGATAPVDSVVFDEDGVSTPSATTELYVHVSGAVAAPGLYVLPAGSRVVDAVAAAGGFAEGADDAAVNLARVLDDGEQLHVPSTGGPAELSGPAIDDSGGLVDLNTADTTRLETLPRIGPAMAERIIAWRDENGRFTSVEDLLAVPGIGDKMLEGLRDLVTV
jgi:competence protein ComEA